MTEERRGFTFEGETVWLTLTELQGRISGLSGVPTKHVMATWEEGARLELTKIGHLIIESETPTQDKALITIYRSREGKIVLGGLGWIERFEWEKSQIEEKRD